MTIDASADITSTDGCITGQVSLINTNFNAYDVNLIYGEAAGYPNNCDSNLYGANGHGIATLDTNVSPTLLEMVVVWIEGTGVVGNSIFIQTLQ